ncbi:carbohydrate kinase [Streptomyces sp. 3MP-14]|uniref:Carbohydrate kinase n=1 Tax=Streptomyces mimosae TaxID=2586635 RepID=A0A5N6AF33_9ACTN|nr:carbohydrate kinase [Streptomyces mimosae]KAB8178888.1 carbohydrate kinase [Streptomyces sp. 3MP-14]
MGRRRARWTGRPGGAWHVTARVAVVGEALVDLLWPTGSREARAVPGGSPANVAVGLHRLRRPVTLLTSWGDDPPGALVGEHLAAIGVDVVRLPTEGPARTTVALAYLAENGSAHYDFLTSWTPAALPLPEDTAVVHTGSLAVAVEPGASRVLELARQQRALGRMVVADLNVRPAVRPDRAAYRALAERLAAEVRVLKASDEDLSWLYPEQDTEEAAETLRALGPELVVVTRGAQGAFGLTPAHRIAVPAPEVRVVDTVGAGDAFQAALLDALATRGAVPTEPEELRRVLTRCARCAALTCAREGADPPTRAQLDGTGAR